MNQALSADEADCPEIMQPNSPGTNPELSPALPSCREVLLTALPRNE
jgi:hypothetical protein